MPRCTKLNLVAKNEEDEDTKGSQKKTMSKRKRRAKGKNVKWKSVL